MSISQLQPFHIHTSQWVGGVFSCLKSTCDTIEVLITDLQTNAPFLFSFPYWEELSSYPIHSGKKYYFFAFGNIEESFSVKNCQLFAATAQNFALFSYDGKVLLSNTSSVFANLSEEFLQGFFQNPLSNKNISFLPVQNVLSLAKLSQIQFSLKEIQILSYKLWAMKDFADVIHTAPCFEANPSANFSSPSFRPDSVFSSSSIEEILSQNTNTKNGYFLVPSMFTKEEQSNESSL